MTQTAPAVREAVPVIVFGRDQTAKPHASWFGSDDAELAEKAAKKMGLSVARAETPDQRALADKLPKGRVFASGRAFVPFVKEAVFLQLVEVAKAAGVTIGGRTADVLSSPELSTTTATSTPQTWDSIDVGSLVLATPGGKGETWYEAIVLSAHDDLFTLFYRDYPHEGQFARQRDQLALIPAGLST